MVNKMIADSLKAGKRLVIPQFGAFIHKDTDGGVVFVPFLKKDDGVLASQLGSAYGLSNEEAYGVIAEYIAQVQKSVTDRGSFVVEGVGRLRVDSNGVCYLEYNPQVTAEPASDAVSSPQATTAPTRPAPVPVAPAPAASPVAAAQPQSAPCPPPVQQPRQPMAGQPVQQTRQAAQPVNPAQLYGQPSAARQTGQSGYGQPNLQQPASPQGYSQQPQGRPMSQQPQQPQQPIPGQPGYAQPRPSAPRGPVAPGRPAPSRRPVSGQGAPGKGTDKFLVIAIIAAVIALGAIVYGVVTSSSDGPRIDPMELPVHERPAILDSIQKQDSIRAAEAVKTGSRSKK